MFQKNPTAQTHDLRTRANEPHLLARFFVALSLGAWAVWATAAVARHAVVTVKEAPKRIRLGAAAAEREFRGMAFMNSIEAIRASIPNDGDYILIGGRRNPTDTHLVRAYLVPRKAEFLGDLSAMDAGDWARLSALQPPRPVVLAWTPAGVPIGGNTAALEAVLGPPPVIRETASLLGGVDEPANKSVVRGPLLIRGWARIPGQDLQVRVEIDGEDRSPFALRRYPRPDVCSILPEMSDCRTAGFEASVAMRPQDVGRRELTLVFLASDGRIRHYPSLSFDWRP